MLQVILTSSVLILVLLLLRRVLRGRVSLRLQYALWVLVAVRLLVPVSFGNSAVSVLNALPDSPASYVPFTGDLGPVSPEAPSSGQPSPAANVGAEPETASPDLSAVPQAPSQEELPANTAAFSLSQLLVPVWLAGVIVMALWFLGVNWTFRRKLRAKARRVELPGCPLPVFVAEGIPSPCLVGLVRPAVYLTSACLDDPARLRHVLAHELTHWRHRDPWWSLVRCLCLALYWFDPLVWLAASLSRRDCELACDEGALARLGEDQRLAYGRTLVGLMTVSASPARLLQTATTMADRKNGLRERVALIARKPKQLAITVVVVILIVAAAVVCTFTAARQAPADDRPLEERLSGLPEDLADSVTVSLGHGTGNPQRLATFTHTATFEASFPSPSSVYSEAASSMGWICDLYRYDAAGFEAAFLSGGDNSGLTCFARDDTFYYALQVPTDVRWIDSTRADYEAACDACTAWVRETVLAQPGVEPFDLSEVLDQPYTYEGAHIDVLYLPYLHVTGDTTQQWGLVLSQPATQGEVGIWCVERWSDGESTYLVRPDTDGLAADYYADLQAQADQGHQTALLDPLQVCLTFAADYFGHSYVQTDSFQVGDSYGSQDQPGGSPLLAQLAQAAADNAIDQRLSNILLYRDPPTEAEAAARLFADTAAQELLDIDKSRDEAVERAETVDVTLLSAADGKITFQFTLAVVPLNPDCAAWQGADLAEGTGDWAGCGLYTREATLLYHSTSWHCIGIQRPSSALRQTFSVTEQGPEVTVTLTLDAPADTLVTEIWVDGAPAATARDEWGIPMETSPTLSLADWNFDGFPDLCCPIGSGTGGNRSIYWLWDPEGQTYIRSDALGVLSNLTRDDTAPILYSIQSSGATLMYYEAYQWTQGALHRLACLSWEALPDGDSLRVTYWEGESEDPLRIWTAPAFADVADYAANAMEHPEDLRDVLESP